MVRAVRSRLRSLIGNARSSGFPSRRSAGPRLTVPSPSLRQMTIRAACTGLANGLHGTSWASSRLHRHRDVSSSHVFLCSWRRRPEVLIYEVDERGWTDDGGVHRVDSLELWRAATMRSVNNCQRRDAIQTCTFHQCGGVDFSQRLGCDVLLQAVVHI